MSNRLYVYLVRRDKKGAQVLTILEGDSMPVRLNDIKQLQLSSVLESEIAAIIHENRMMWEPWVESADSYVELRKCLRKRGYTNIALHGTPLYRQTDLYNLQKANTKKLPIKNSMLRRI